MTFQTSYVLPFAYYFNSLDALSIGSPLGNPEYPEDGIRGKILAPRDRLAATLENEKDIRRLKSDFHEEHHF